jgi:hypothetical protein
MDHHEPASDRRLPVKGPLPGDAGWLALSDDELLFRIESLAAGHTHDEDLLRVLASSRHFFIRQEAAKRIGDTERLKAFASDRHVGQILARHMRRDQDTEYLEQLVRETRHLEVRKAALAQLEHLRRKREREGRK